MSSKNSYIITNSLYTITNKLKKTIITKSPPRGWILSQKYIITKTNSLNLTNTRQFLKFSITSNVTS